MGSTNLKGTKCSDSATTGQTINIASCIKDTGEDCVLKNGEKGTQEVSVENIKRHAVDVSIEITSQNDTIEFSNSQTIIGSSFDRDLIVGPNSMSNNASVLLEVGVEQSGNVFIKEDTISVETEFEYDASSRAKRSGPCVYPRIDLR